MNKPVRDSIFKVLTHPALERFRAWIPYPLYVSLVTFIFAIPMAALTAPAWQEAILMPPIGAAVVGALIGLLALGGRLSGYCPHQTNWEVMESDAAPRLSQRLRDTAQAQGFQILWHAPGGDFVAVWGLELEARVATHKGNEAPIRLVFHLSGPPSRQRARLRVEGRTVVLWDTGERARVESIGLALARDVSLAGLRGVQSVSPP
jgi:hypothetical protein